MTEIDEATSIREGEELSADALAAWFAENAAELAPERPGGLHVRQFPGGASNLIYSISVYGLFRLAVIVQQIYRRYVDGKTGDKRFARFGGLPAVLADQCRRVMAGA